jgi:probable addiction module antidote protein
MKIKIKDLPKFDVVDYLKTEKDIVGYLSAVLEDGDPALFVAAIGDIARTKVIHALGMKLSVHA